MNKWPLKTDLRRDGAGRGGGGGGMGADGVGRWRCETLLAGRDEAVVV
jgi:hypothetical protein